MEIVYKIAKFVGINRYIQNVKKKAILAILDGGD